MNFDSILLAVDQTADLPFLLEKAVRLANACRARLTVVRTVYEGIAEFNAESAGLRHDLKTFIMAAAEAELEEHIAGMRSRLPGITALTLWNVRPHEGFLHAAQRTGAKLILRGVTAEADADAHRGRPVRTPDDWNLLRRSPVPVMLLRPDAWPRDPVVLAAIDPFDAAHDATSRTVLRFSRDLAVALSAALDVVVAYPLFEPWAGQLGFTRSLHELQRDVEGEIRTRVQTLARESGVDYRRLIADEGTAVSVIGRIVEEDNAQVVVLGTQGREGVRGVVLGNTCERVLHATHCDLCTVPGEDRG